MAELELVAKILGAADAVTTSIQAQVAPPPQSSFALSDSPSSCPPPLTPSPRGAGQQHRGHSRPPAAPLLDGVDGRAQGRAAVRKSTVSHDGREDQGPQLPIS